MENGAEFVTNIKYVLNALDARSIPIGAIIFPVFLNLAFD